MNSIFDALDKFDIFKSKPAFLIDKEPEISSRVGRCLSLFFMMIVLFYIYTTLESYFLFDTYMVNNIYEIADRNIPLVATRDNLMFSISLDNVELNSNFDK